jgi:hypothetical protein
LDIPFSSEMCADFGYRERERGRGERAAKTIIIFSLLPQKIEGGRAVPGALIITITIKASILSLSPPPPHHDKNKERPVELTIFILTDRPRVRIGSHLVIHFVGSRGTHPEAWFGL